MSPPKLEIQTRSFRMNWDLISAFKLISLLGCIIVFLYWSITATTKYISGPITSTVTYKFGDDGQGNIKFPAITICLDSFKWIAASPNGMYNNCLNGQVKNFYNALISCTHDNKLQTATTTTINSMFGNMFDENVEKAKPFERIDDLIQVRVCFAEVKF